MREQDTDTCTQPDDSVEEEGEELQKQGFLFQIVHDNPEWQ